MHVLRKNMYTKLELIYLYLKCSKNTLHYSSVQFLCWLNVNVNKRGIHYVWLA